MNRRMIVLLALTTLMTAFLPQPGTGFGQDENPSKKRDIVVSGKVFCPIKRNVVVPFHSLITHIAVEPGAKVQKGDVLVRYRLETDSLLELRRRVYPVKWVDQQVRIDELRSRLGELRKKHVQVQTLVRSDLAPKGSLNKIESEIGLLSRTMTAMEDRVEKEKNLAFEDMELLERLLGEKVGIDEVPTEGRCLAPISGYVVKTHPDLRVGAEFTPGTPVIQIGEMDQMILRALVHEIEAVQLKDGDRARVIFESLPGREFQGVMNRMSWAPAELQLGQPTYYEVEFIVPNPDHSLKEGYTAKIFLNSH